MKKDLLKSLVKIADKLDKENNFEDADVIDSAVNTIKAINPSEEDVEIPDDELEALQVVLESLSDSLKGGKLIKSPELI